jgi:hypothetical protein
MILSRSHVNLIEEIIGGTEKEKEMESEQRDR